MKNFRSSNSSVKQYKIFFGFVVFACIALVVVGGAQIMTKKYPETKNIAAAGVTNFSIGLSQSIGKNIKISDQLSTNKNIGYVVKLTPAYSGPTEVLFNGKISSWYPASGGLIFISPEIMKGVGPGIYPMRLRANPAISPLGPDGHPLIYPWSNQAIVLVKNLLGETPGLKVQVSVDGKTYSDSITTTLEKGYYLKTTPVYIGMLEAQVVGGRHVKWLATDENGIAFAAPEVMKKGTSTFSPSQRNTTYKAKFRPYMADFSIDENMYPQSNVVTVLVK